MKKILILFSFTISSVILAQEMTVKKTETIVPKDSIYTIHTTVDEPASYPKGLDDFRAKFIKNFNFGNFAFSGLLQTELSFIVSKDGTLENITALGNNQAFNEEAVKALKSMKKIKWKPAKVNGKPVKYLSRLPFRMNFE